jgi:hypothetical protein
VTNASDPRAKHRFVMLVLFAASSLASAQSNPDFAVAHPPSSSPYSFRVEARFDGSHGSGKRLEQRECNFAFDRK